MLARGGTPDLNDQPEAPFLTFRGGGGSENEVSASGGLWLWQLPD